MVLADYTTFLAGCAPFFGVTITFIVAFAGVRLIVDLVTGALS
jgi:hypothetical protein